MRVIGIACLALLPAACRTSQATGSQPIEPGILIVLPGAEDVRFTREYEGVVSYALNVPYPGNAVIGQISKQLEEKCWVPRERDFLNPEVSGSQEWGSLQEANGSHVYQRIVQWQDRSGRVVWYTLRYQATMSPQGAITPNGWLHVQAALFSADHVARVEQTLKSGKKD